MRRFGVVLGFIGPIIWFLFFVVICFLSPCLPVEYEQNKQRRHPANHPVNVFFLFFLFLVTVNHPWINLGMAAKKKHGGHNKTPKAKVDAVVDGLKQGRGINQLAVDTGLGRTTVALIREQNRDVVPNWRRNTAQSMMELASDLVDHLRDTYEDLPPHSKPILLGILSDKIRDLTSEGGQIVQHQHVHINHADVNALISGTTGTKK